MMHCLFWKVIFSDDYWDALNLFNTCMPYEVVKEDEYVLAVSRDGLSLQSIHVALRVRLVYF